MKTIQTIGIIGAGKLGTVLAQITLNVGLDVYISGSGSPDRIKLVIDTLAPGAIATTTKDAVRRADIVILALPLSKFRHLSPDVFAGKLVIDATNYWWEVDGPRQEILSDDQSSSEAIQAFLADSRVVKALSHMSYHDLYDEPKPSGTQDRKAIAIAGDSPADVTLVSDLVDALGFDPVPIGNLAAGQLLEPGGNAFGADVDAATLRRLLDITDK